jgi:hypothetical protein
MPPPADDAIVPAIERSIDPTADPAPTVPRSTR